MSLFDFFRIKKQAKSFPWTVSGSGVSIDDPVKIIPNDLGLLAENAYKVFSEQGKADLIPGSDNEKLLNMRGVVAETCKKIYLENRFGKLGSDYSLGDRVYLSNSSIQVQKIITNNNGEFDIYFDFSAFGSSF